MFFMLLGFSAFAQKTYEEKDKQFQKAQQVEFIELYQWTLTTMHDGEYKICSGCVNLYHMSYRSKYKIWNGNYDKDGKEVYQYKMIMYFSSASFWPNSNPANTRIENLQMFFKDKEILYVDWAIIGRTPETMYPIVIWLDNFGDNAYVTFRIEKLTLN